MEEGESEVCATVLNGSAGEINSQLRLESVDVAEAKLSVRKQANEVCIDSEIDPVGACLAMEICSDSEIVTSATEKEEGESVDVAEAELTVRKQANEFCIDSETDPVGACLAMEICNDSEIVTSATEKEEGELVLDNTQLDNSNSDIGTKKVSNNSEILQPSAVERNVMDVANLNELKPCSETQCREDKLHDELETATETHEKEVLSSTEMEPSAESKKNEDLDEHFVKNLAEETLNVDKVETGQAVNDNDMYPCSKNHAVEVPDKGDLELFCASNEVAEVPNDFMLEPCPMNKVEEASNDDVYSEVSNPNLSPKHVTSSLTVSSQPLDVLGGDQGGFGEITSACSPNSSVDGSFCKEKLSKSYRLESVSTSRVELEIPKHVSTTGIRKITFKFSKRKEDYDSPISVAGRPMLINEFHEDHNDKRLCASAAQHLTSNGFQNKAYNAFEAGDTNAATNLIMDGNEFHDPQSPFSCAPNRELKMSKKIVPHNYPTNVKKLLSTRILEGARVKYISVSGEKEIPGIIKDSGYLCGCGLCNFSKVVSAYEFELHAGTKTRHPNNHIYMENGRPIYSIIQELRTAPLSTLDDVLKAVAGSSINEEYYQVWKANLQHGNSVAYADGAYQSKHFSTDDSISSHSSQPIEDNTFPASCHYPCIIPYNQQSYIEAPMEQKRLHKKPRHDLYGSVLEQKKTTKSGTKKRDNDLHKLLFMPNGLPDGTDLAYYAKGKRILGGYKQGNGIVCSCCNTELSPSQFEAHAGWSAKRQPYRHIYTSSGLTLHDIALMLANGQNIVTGGSDDMCAVCGDGGELIICNGCPRAFHADCLDLQSLPADDWHCPYCTDNFGSGRKTARESRPIILRLTRVVKAPEFETGGCIICRSQDFSAAKFDDLTVILCDQCEKEYHVGCLRERGMCDLRELPKDKWFCCDDCDKIFSALQILASSGPEVIPTSVSAAICRKHAAIGLKDGSNNVIQWRLLSGKSRFPEHLVLLSQAAAIFRECFDPIIATSGRDLIPVMVYARNISGQEFSGMYCIVLIVNSVVVSAALLRIFGQEVAELPLVATSRESQGKGYFQALFSCIERLLSSMNVKHLVLPAAEEAEPMWTKKLGFTKTSHEQMLKYRRDLQLTIFKGTSLLEKGVQQLAD